MRPSAAVPVSIVVLLVVLPVSGADVAAPITADIRQIIYYIENEATLYALRTKFSVMLRKEAEEALEQEVKQVTQQGLTSGAEERQLGELLAEAGYFSTSLKYLILSGGAAWPTDRNVKSYENDALAIIGDMQYQIQQELAAQIDVLPALYQLELVWGWTNGETSVDEGSPLLLRDLWVSEALRHYSADCSQLHDSGLAPDIETIR